MAIRKNKDNPEEGTPEKRSRQDIRRERRQMRAMNIQRKEMGGEPLYSKQEIRDVKKPFEPVPSEEMKGFVNKSEDQDIKIIKDKEGKPKVQFIYPDGSTYTTPSSKEEVEKQYGSTYNQSDIASTPDVEYKLYEPGGMGVESKESKPVAITEEQKTNIIENNPSGQAISNAIKANSLNDDKKTLNDKQNDFKIANQTEEEIDNTNKGIDNEVKDKEKEIVGGDGRTMANKMDGAGEQYDWTLSEPPIEFTPTSEEDIYSQARLAKKKVPQLVIEKLGIQDYYPEIGRNIAVGTFTGSRIGSQTIYSGAGGLLPLGLYDARKRAIAAEIKRKEAIMDQIKEIPDIAKQFKTEYSQLYMDFLSPWLKAYKDNPEGLMSNTDFLRDMAHYKSVAENFLKVDSDLKNFKKLLEPKDGEPAAWATPAMLEIQRKFLSGFLPGKTEEWLKGKKNISKLTETLQALPNGYKWMDKKVVDLFKDPMKVKRAITPKDGVEWTPELKDKINDLSQSVSDGSTDYETYLTVMKEYFDFNFSSMVNEWVDGSTLDALTDKEKEDLKKSLTIYAEAQLPKESFIPTIVRQNNDNAAKYAADKALQGKLAQIGWEREKFEREQAENPTNALINAAMLSPDGKFSQTYSGSKANQQPSSLLTVKVKNSKGEIVQVNAADLKKNLRSDGKVTQRYWSTLTGKELTANDYKNMPDVITYQPTQGNVYKSGNDYQYNTNGVGYYSVTEIDKNTNQPVNTLKALPVEYGTYDLPATQNGNKVTSTIIGGNVLFGQGTNIQSTKAKESSSSSSYERE